jgi:hypothetical protein
MSKNIVIENPERSEPGWKEDFHLPDTVIDVLLLLKTSQQYSEVPPFLFFEWFGNSDRPLLFIQYCFSRLTFNFFNLKHLLKGWRRDSSSKSTCLISVKPWVQTPVLLKMKKKTKNKKTFTHVKSLYQKVLVSWSNTDMNLIFFSQCP